MIPCLENTGQSKAGSSRFSWLWSAIVCRGYVRMLLYSGIPPVMIIHLEQKLNCKKYVYKLSAGTRIIHELTFKELLKLKCFSGKQQVWCEVRLHVWVWGSRVWCILPVRAPSSEHSWGVKAGGGQIALYKLEVSSSARTFWWGTARNLHVHILE